MIEINKPHPHLRSRRGHNDAIDAEAAARKVLSSEATATATDKLLDGNPCSATRSGTAWY